jgi:hypothetical protein
LCPPSGEVIVGVIKGTKAKALFQKITQSTEEIIALVSFGAAPIMGQAKDAYAKIAPAFKRVVPVYGMRTAWLYQWHLQVDADGGARRSDNAHLK